MDAQRKRRAPTTYGKLFTNRSRVSGDGLPAAQTLRREENEESVGDKLAHRDSEPGATAVKSTRVVSGKPSTVGQGKQHRVSKPELSINVKPRLGRTNSTPSGGSITDFGVFDVPSSGEDTRKEPIMRRTLSNSLSKDISRKEEKKKKRAHSNNRGDEKKCASNILTLGEMISQQESKVLGGTAYTERTARPQTVDVIPRSPVRKPPSAMPLPLRVNAPPVMRRTTRASSAQAEERSRIAAEDVASSSFVREPRRERKCPEPQRWLAQETILESSRPEPFKYKQYAAKASQRQPTPPPPSKSSFGVDSLHISSPVKQAPKSFSIQIPQRSSEKAMFLVKEPTFRDEVMADTEPQQQKNFPRKPRMKRSRETETPNQDMEREITPPRRGRLIDSLEVDQTIYRSKKRIIEAEMDLDGGSENEDTPLTNSQSLVDSNVRALEDSPPQPMQLGGQNPPAFIPRNTKVTYARQRSFLTEDPKGELDLLSDPLLLPVRDFGRSIFKPPVLDDMEEDTPNGQGMMKSLHELREAGVNKRFLDNVEGYFEDIEGVSVGQRRIGYMDLATKLKDKSFIQKFRMNNFDRRILSGVRKQDDKIVRFILGFIVWSLLEEDQSSRILQLISKNGVIHMLDDMLEDPRDMKSIVKDKGINLTKQAQSLLLEFCDLLAGTSIFGGPIKVLSPQILALAVLDSITKALRHGGWMGDCLSKRVLKKLIQILEPLQTATPAKRGSIESLYVELPISILESHSIGGDDSRKVELSREDLKTLATIVPVILHLEGDGLKSAQLLTLRLVINLTNHRPATCDIFSKTRLISTLVNITKINFEALSGFLEEEERLIQLDMLVLSLALMINFAEMSEAGRLAFMEGAYNTSQLSTLLNLFLGRMERAAEADSMEESQSNVGFGYLSILLGNLCQNSSVRNTVRSKMPKGNLAPLVSAVQEFVSHNQRVDDERRQLSGGEGENWHSGFTERLEQVAVRLRAIEGLS